MYPKEESLSSYMREAKKLEIIDNEKKIKIAILSSFTVTGLAEVIKVKCKKIEVSISHEKHYAIAASLVFW